MTRHKPYHEGFGHPHDFVVEYRFLSEGEGGRQVGPPFQGYRSDFWYEQDNQATNQLFMIWPEFLDEDGNVIIETDKIVAVTGKARMWIVNENMRAFHQQRIKIGMTGYFMEGPNKVAVCKVTEISGLMTNPTKE